MGHSSIRRAMLTLVAAAAAAATPLAAQPQTRFSVDSRWLPFLGCWSTAPIADRSALLCVSATSAPTVVELATVVGDSVTATERLDASGARVPFVADGCTGWQSTRWSRNERRFFLSASFTCADSVPQSSSGIVSMKSADSFSRVEGVERGSYRAVRMTTFDAANNVAVAPATLQARAGARVTPADIIEASSILSAPIVDAWLADYADTVEVTMGELRAMRKARVPASSIDMMIAISNPVAFRVAAAGERASRPGAQALAGGAWGWGLGFGVAPDLSASYFGRASQRLSAWNRWNGVTPDNWFAGNMQFTIIPQAQAPARSSGSVVFGKGYVSGSGTQSGIASPRSDASTSGPGSGSGQSGGSGGRTAQPRP